MRMRSGILSNVSMHLQSGCSISLHFRVRKEHFLPLSHRSLFQFLICISSAVISSIQTDDGTRRNETESEIPPVREIWFKYRSIAVAMETPNWDKTLSTRSFTTGFTLKFNVAVFLHDKPSYNFIVTLLSLQKRLLFMA